MLDYIPATRHSMPFRKLNELVRGELGRPDYEAAKANHWENDSSHRFNVDLGMYDQYMQGRVKAFIEKDLEACYVVWILCELARRGIIPEGLYTVEVSW